MKQKAFSLVELLIVICVIGMLVAMAAPSYPRATEMFRQVACKANLRSLSVMLRASREAQRENGEWQSGQPPFVRTYKWPGTVAFDSSAWDPLVCPSDGRSLKGSNMALPPVLYRTAQWPRPFLPFDPEDYSCVMRTGVDKFGESYTEFCIEDDLRSPADWAYSINDGIWRVFDRVEGRRKKVVLTYFTCTWQNELWVDGVFYADLGKAKVGLTFYFDYADTSYAYNAGLQDEFVVGDGTIVLLDHPKAYVDATDSNIYAELDNPGGARHFGKHNVLSASGAVKTQSSVSLYPDINMGQWTADPTD